MKYPYTIPEIAEIIRAECLPAPVNRQISQLTTDSRELSGADMFFAFKGESFNGIDYISECIGSGIRSFVVNAEDFLARNLGGKQWPEGTAFLLVEDSMRAWGMLARNYLTKFPGKRIAITGSTGKTTTKNMLRAMLSASYNVFANEKNYNNHIGLPASIFRIDKPYDYYIFEMGMNHAGEIAWLTEIVHPDIALITNIAPAHIGHFGSIEGVARAKAEIFHSQPASGVVFLNTNDEHFSFLSGLASKRLREIVPFSGDGVDIKTSISDAGEVRSFLIVRKDALIVRIPVPFAGGFNRMNIAGALAVALHEDVPLEAALSVMSDMIPEHSRFQIIPGDPVIIDDAYNANPRSMLASLESLLEFAAHKDKTIVLGDMFELGDDAADYHAQLGRTIERLFYDSHGTSFILVGALMKHAFETLSSPEKLYFATTEEALFYLKKNLKHKHIYYFKASNGMKFNSIIKELTCSIT